MKIRGHHVLVSERSFLAWCREYGFDPRRDGEPEKYPCIVEIRGGCSSEYLNFTSMDMVSDMGKALSRAISRTRQKKRSGGGALNSLTSGNLEQLDLF